MAVNYWVEETGVWQWWVLTTSFERVSSLVRLCVYGWVGQTRKWWTRQLSYGKLFILALSGWAAAANCGSFTTRATTRRLATRVVIHPQVGRSSWSRWAHERKEKDELLAAASSAQESLAGASLLLGHTTPDGSVDATLPSRSTAFGGFRQMPPLKNRRGEWEITYSQRVIPSLRTWAKSSWSRRPSDGWG